MRYLAAAILTICAGLALAKSASAGYDGPYLCWTSSAGGTNCVGLAINYRLQGVSRPLEPYGTASFTLTRPLINRISQYASTAGMHPAQRAIIYAPGYGTHGSRY